MKTIRKISFWLKAIFVHKQVWLDDYDGSTKAMEFIHRKVYNPIWKWNWKNEWLRSDRSFYGTSYEHGKFIESESSERGSIYKIKFAGFEIVLQYGL